MSFWCKVLGHRWDACRCARCGAERDKGHRFEKLENVCREKCQVCGKEEKIPHAWNRCVCTQCAKVRDKNHDWMYTTECERICRLCGEESAEHLWQPMERGMDRCRQCGKLHKLTPEEILQRDEEWASEFE